MHSNGAMNGAAMNGAVLPPATAEAYRLAMNVLKDAGLPFLVGGAYAFACFTGISRHTKDFDLFVRPDDLDRVMEAFEAAGFETQLTYPHWLAKAFLGAHMIDVIFRSGNGVAEVDAAWFERAEQREVLGVSVPVCPPEEIIWSKAFIMERERYDGADVAHLLRGCNGRIDWAHLIARFGPHWRVLFSHLVLFGFIYPEERNQVPAEVMQTLCARLHEEAALPAPAEHVCQGTLLSREQYLKDVADWGYEDARLYPRGNMSAVEIAHWTNAIGSKDDPREGTEEAGQ